MMGAGVGVSGGRCEDIGRVLGGRWEGFGGW